MSNKKIINVKRYWDKHPIFSYEKSLNDLNEYYNYVNEIKRNDIEKFAFNFWDFNNYSNKKVLDIGFGTGWYSFQYAKGNANVFAIDLSSNAVKNVKKIADFLGLDVNIREGNAEKLEFPSNYFDLVISNGVLHHTPDYKEAINESFRILKPGGISKLTFYRKGILHNPFVWPILRITLKFFKVKHPGSDFSVNVNNVDDFICQYDGSLNPVGIGKKNRTWANHLEEAGYKIKKIENHYFPIRLIPFNKYVPVFVHKILDMYFGTMVYFLLTKD